MVIRQLETKEDFDRVNVSELILILGRIEKELLGLSARRASSRQSRQNYKEYYVDLADELIRTIGYFLYREASHVEKDEKKMEAFIKFMVLSREVFTELLGSTLDKYNTSRSIACFVQALQYWGAPSRTKAIEAAVVWTNLSRSSVRTYHERHRKIDASLFEYRNEENAKYVFVNTVWLELDFAFKKYGQKKFHSEYGAINKAFKDMFEFHEKDSGGCRNLPTQPFWPFPAVKKAE